jgi:hypothetical protein
MYSFQSPDMTGRTSLTMALLSEVDRDRKCDIRHRICHKAATSPKKPAKKAKGEFS